MDVDLDALDHKLRGCAEKDAQDPDGGKPRATVQQYAALIGQKVMNHLEGLALARKEKRARPYQTDAEIHQSYIKITSGGGHGQEDEPGDEGPANAPPQQSREVFPLLSWAFDQNEMRSILDFEHRTRLTPLQKEFVALPCMSSQVELQEDGAACQARRANCSLWRNKYKTLAEASVQEKQELKQIQEEALDVNAAEDHIEVVARAPRRIKGKQKPLVATFVGEGVYEKPSGFIRHLIGRLPEKERLNRRQTLFMAQFAQACDEVWEDESKPPKERRVHHMLLLGAGGAGKTHVVQKLVFEAVSYIWPNESPESPSMLVVASSNAQAKNISTAQWKGRTLHNAGCIRVQEMVNEKMRPGGKADALEKLWGKVRVLVLEEVSMVSAHNYNMLDFRAMHGRTKTHDVTESTYKMRGCTFGRCPIVIHLGDFLQLSPTASLSLVADVNAKNADGSYVLEKPPSVEAQHAINVFKRIQTIIELKETRRFVVGDPLIKFLDCMRKGVKIPAGVWKAFEKTFATDTIPGQQPQLDPRHKQTEFLEGYGMALYWETLARWITRRARRDARVLGVPLVFLQAADECQTLDKVAYSRLLNVTNIYKTARIHGVFASHIGMRVRFTGKFSAAYGLVQEQKATIVSFIFHEDDDRRYRETAAGEIFRPRRMPTGVWLEVDQVDDLPAWESLKDYVPEEKLARGLFCMPLMDDTFTWETSNVAHTVKRIGFMLTHANYLTINASQGQTIRAKVTIDCARAEPQGSRGMSDDEWWLNLYVMLSRVTRMEDMLLLRPPPRTLVERGPPASVRRALQRFDKSRKQR